MCSFFQIPIGNLNFLIDPNRKLVFLLLKISTSSFLDIKWNTNKLGLNHPTLIEECHLGPMPIKRSCLPSMPRGVTRPQQCGLANKQRNCMNDTREQCKMTKLPTITSVPRLSLPQEGDARRSPGCTFKWFLSYLKTNIVLNKITKVFSRNGET